jgi:hypothetical protein
MNLTPIFATLLFIYTYKIYNDARPIQHKDYNGTFTFTTSEGRDPFIQSSEKTGPIIKIQSTVYLTK